MDTRDPSSGRTPTSTGTRTTTRTKVIIAVVAAGAAAAGFGFFLPKYCAENPDKCRRSQKAAQEYASDDLRTPVSSDDRRTRASDDPWTPVSSDDRWTRAKDTEKDTEADADLER